MATLWEEFEKSKASGGNSDSNTEPNQKLTLWQQFNLSPEQRDSYKKYEWQVIRQNREQKEADNRAAMLNNYATKYNSYLDQVKEFDKGTGGALRAGAGGFYHSPETYTTAQTQLEALQGVGNRLNVPWKMIQSMDPKNKSGMPAPDEMSKYISEMSSLADAQSKYYGQYKSQQHYDSRLMVPEVEVKEQETLGPVNQNWQQDYLKPGARLPEGTQSIARGGKSASDVSYTDWMPAQVSESERLAQMGRGETYSGYVTGVPDNAIPAYQVPGNLSQRFMDPIMQHIIEMDQREKQSDPLNKNYEPVYVRLLKSMGDWETMPTSQRVTALKLGFQSDSRELSRKINAVDTPSPEGRRAEIDYKLQHETLTAEEQRKLESERTALISNIEDASEEWNTGNQDLIFQKAALDRQAKRYETIEGWQKVDQKYQYVWNNADFLDNSAYNPNKLASGAGKTGKELQASQYYEYFNASPERRQEMELPRVTYAASATGNVLPIITEASVLLNGMNTLNANEISVFNYLYNKQGANAAMQYLDEKKTEFLSRNALLRQKRMEEMTEEDLEFMSFATLYWQVENALLGPAQFMAGVIGADPNDPIFRKQSDVQVVRNKAGQVLDEFYGSAMIPILNVPVASTLYNAGMSAGDSFVGRALGAVTGYQGLNRLLMTSRVLGSEMQASLRDGDSTGMSIFKGLAAAIIENVTEAIGDKAFYGTPRNAATYIAQQFFSEGSEEFLADLGNSLVDMMAKGTESDIYQNALEAAGKRGWSRETAQSFAFNKWLKEAGTSFLSGALMGLMSSTYAAPGYQSRMNEQRTTERYDSIMAQEGITYSPRDRFNLAVGEIMNGDQPLTLDSFLKEEETRTEGYVRAEQATTPYTQAQRQRDIALSRLGKTTQGDVGTQLANASVLDQAATWYNEQRLAALAEQESELEIRLAYGDKLDEAQAGLDSAQEGYARVGESLDNIASELAELRQRLADLKALQNAELESPEATQEIDRAESKMAEIQTLLDRSTPTEQLPGAKAEAAEPVSKRAALQTQLDTAAPAEQVPGQAQLEQEDQQAEDRRPKSPGPDPYESQRREEALRQLDAEQLALEIRMYELGNPGPDGWETQHQREQAAQLDAEQKALDERRAALATPGPDPYVANKQREQQAQLDAEQEALEARKPEKKGPPQQPTLDQFRAELEAIDLNAPDALDRIADVQKRMDQAGIDRSEIGQVPYKGDKVRYKRENIPNLQEHRAKNPDLNDDSFDFAAEAAYGAGLAGSRTLFEISAAIRDLAPETAKSLFEAGLGVYNARKGERDALKSRLRNYMPKPGQGKLNIPKELIAKMNQEQKQLARELQIFMIMAGFEGDLFAGEQADDRGRILSEEGSFDPATGRFRFDINAGINFLSQLKNKDRGVVEFALPRVMGHEFTHYLKVTAPDLYTVFQDNLLEALANKNSLDDLVREELARGRKGDLTYGVALEEVIARSSEMMMRDSQALQNAMGGNKTLWEKFKSWVSEFVNNIRERMKGMNPAYAGAKSLMEAGDGIVKYVGDLQSMWDKAMSKSIEDRIDTPGASQEARGASKGKDKGVSLSSQESGAKGAGIAGNEGVMYTATDNTPVKFKYKMFSIKNLIASHDEKYNTNPAFPEELQPRDRERAGLKDQVFQIAKNLNPARLGKSAEVATGAPVIGPDMVVEAGNGRVMALRTAMASYPEMAKAYTRWLKENAKSFGLNASDISDDTVLVRERVDAPGFDRAAFAEKGNVSPTAVNSETENAAADAEKVTPDMLAVAELSGGELNMAGDSRFVTKFIDKIIPLNERNSFIDKSGRVSQRGETRIRNALFQRAYGDEAMTAQLAEVTEGEVRNVIKAMTNIAPRIAQMNADVESGKMHPVVPTTEILQAYQAYKNLKQTGGDVEAYLAQLPMIEMDKGAAKALVAMFEANKNAPRRMTDILNAILDVAGEKGNPQQTMLPGLEGLDATKLSVVREGVAREAEAERFSERDNYAPPMYSKMAREIEAYKGDKLGADSVVKYLQGRGVKADEIRWSGIVPFLQGKKSVSKAELLEFAKASALRVEDFQLGGRLPVTDIEFEQMGGSYNVKKSETQTNAWELRHSYSGRVVAAVDQTQTGENAGKWESLPGIYSEMEPKVFDTEQQALAWLEKAKKEDISVSKTPTMPKDKFSKYKLNDGTNYRELLFTAPDLDGSFQSAHWDEKNVLAHTRLQDFQTPDGKPVLFVEEVQSDWHEKGREEGYAKPVNVIIGEYKSQGKEGYPDIAQVHDDNENLIGYIMPMHGKYVADAGNGQRIGAYETEKQALDALAENEKYRFSEVPEAPFSTTWHEYVLKRVLRMAAEGDYDYVAWTTGKMQADRYWGNAVISDAVDRFIEVTKPESVRVLADNIFGGKMAGLMPLNVMDGGMLTAAQNDKVRDVIISNIPVDVMDILSTAQLSPEDIFRNEDVVFNNLPVDSRTRVASAVLGTLRDTGATIRTKLEGLSLGGGEILLFPTLKASDLNSREVAGLLNPQALFHLDTSTLPKEGTSTGAITKSLPRQERGSPGKNLSTTKLAELLNAHASIIHDNEGLVKHGFEAPQGEGMKAFYDIGGKSSQNIPRFLNKYAGQWGAKVQNIEMGEHTVPAVEVTEQMRDSVLYEGQPLYAERDSAGTILSPQQVEYFKDSKVRDEQGRLLKVYHGTDKRFTVFSKELRGSRNRTASGMKYFYASDRETAESYSPYHVMKNLSEQMPKMFGAKDVEAVKGRGGVMPLYLLIRNPLEVDVIDYDWLSHTENRDALMEYIDEAERNGNDGLIFHHVPDNNIKPGERSSTVYLFKEPEQAKSTTNLTPTSDPDIRYAERDHDALPSARAILGGAFGQVAQTDAEKKRVAAYRRSADRYNRLEAELNGLLEKRKQLYRDKAPQAEKNELRADINALKDKLHKVDKALFNLQAMKPLRDVVTREREKAATEQRSKSQERQKEYREQVRLKSKEQLAEWKNKYKVKEAEKASRNKFRESIKKLSKDLGEAITHPTGKKHVPEILRGAIGNFLSSVNEQSQRSLRGGADTIADRAFYDRMDAMVKAISNLRQMENDAGQEIEDAYESVSGYLDISDDFVKDMAELVNQVKDIVDSGSEEYILNRMTIEQLKALDMHLKGLSNAVKQMNAFHDMQGYKAVDEAGKDTHNFLSKMVSKLHRVGKADRFLNWSNMEPMYALDRMGPAGKALGASFISAQDRLAKNAKQIVDFSEATWSEKDILAWERELHTFTVDGGKVTMNTAQLMSLYLLNKRDQARGHLYGGGIRVENFKAGRKVQVDSGHVLLESEVNTMLKKLTPEQRKAADAIQQFMSTVGAEWGNTVTMARWGFDYFGEQNYFPIESARENIDERIDSAEGNPLYRLLNMGFTKGLAKGANNQIMLRNIFDVFAAHMSDMAQYNAFALPLLNAIKWYNYREGTKERGTGRKRITSVRKDLRNAYGDAAPAYIYRLLTDISGARMTGSSGAESFGLSMLRRYNRSVVAANVRVALLQPTAIMRAHNVIDARYLTAGALKNIPQLSKNIREMEKYSGIAIWKQMGFYDINLSRSLQDMIKRDSPLLDRMTEKSMAFPQMMDRLTWAAIWGGARSQVAAQNPGMDRNSEAFFVKVQELFDEAIYRTQVVDTMLTRSEQMRETNFISKMTSSFMSEPTKTYNIMAGQVHAFTDDLASGMSKGQAWSKHRRKIGRTMMTYALSVALTTAVEALMGAWRDDDDYKTFREKFLGELKGNALDNLIPFNWLPIVKDFWQMGKNFLGDAFGLDLWGFEQKSILTEGAQWLSNGVSRMISYVKDPEGKMFYGAAYELLRGVSAVTGHPLSSATREVVDFWNNTAGTVYPEYKIKRYPEKVTPGYEKIYEALVAQDTEAEAKFRGLVTANNKGATDKDIDKNINTGLNKLINADFDEGKIGLEEALTRKTEWAGYTGAQNDIRDSFKLGDIDREEAERLLVKFGKEKEPKELFRLLERWENEDTAPDKDGDGVPDFAILDSFTEAVRTGKNLRQVVKEYTDPDRYGYTPDYLAGQITSAFKQEYIDNPSRRSTLKGYLLNAYVMLGHDRDKKSTEIDRWLMKYDSDDFEEAIATGINLKEVIDEKIKYSTAKNPKGVIISQVTATFADQYKKMTPTERAKIKPRLIDAYVMLGYDRAYSSKKIDKWLTD